MVPFLILRRVKILSQQAVMTQRKTEEEVQNGTELNRTVEWSKHPWRRIK